LPAIFAQPAGWGDLAEAVAALIVLIRYKGKEIPAGAVRAVAAVGIADAISAFSLAFSAATRRFSSFRLTFQTG
jgi:hypothetical protein